MPSLLTTRENNSELRRMIPGPVAVFVGGTSGIGEATCTEFVRNTSQPVVYIIGRNQAHGLSLVEKLEALNTTAKIHFLPSDLTLLRNVDEVCRLIKEKESKVNLLFMTAGFLSMKGRNETTEGLDKMYSLQYYSRMRFVVNLLPLLDQARSSDELARVVSILGAGNEGKIFTDDLPLKKNYSLKNCAGQSICMTSLSFERFATHNPGISFIHVAPGIVRDTNIMSGMGPVISRVNSIFAIIARPFTVSLRECAERQLFVATSRTFTLGARQSWNLTADSTSFRLGWNGESCNENKFLSTYIRDGIDKTVWDHTLAVFGNICK